MHWAGSKASLRTVKFARSANVLSAGRATLGAVVARAALTVALSVVISCGNELIMS